MSTGVVMWPNDKTRCMACGRELTKAVDSAVEVLEWLPSEERNVVRGCACPEHLVTGLLMHLTSLPAGVL